MRQTQRFSTWLANLRDSQGRATITRRIDRMRRGNLGDHRAIGHGLSEMRIDVGPGYRVYFVKRERAWIALICAGDKDSQRRDIEQARKLAEEI